MNQLSKLALVMAIAGVGFGPALAQNAQTTPPTSPAAPAAMQHSPQSIECSKEADAKGLHGKARKKFRKACKKKGAPGGAGNSSDVD